MAAAFATVVFACGYQTLSGEPEAGE